jgi:phosphatidylserine/phosphatidylglycerophosphate/cardiolipin synthase-like enzyme
MKVGAAEVFFSPSRDCETQIVKAIDSSKTEIVAAVYSINNDRIVDAFKRARSRGVKIRILTDRTQAAGHSSKIPELSSEGFNVRVHSKNKIEHNKFGVFDSKIAVNGSYNWTNPASDSNSENCVVFNEKNIISSYRTRFEELWKLNTAAKSDKYLSKIMRKKERSTAAEK